MSHLFKGQTIEISLDTEIDLSAASVKKILFRKPNGDKGFFDAEVSGTKLLFTTDAEIDMYGQWSFQAYAEIGDAKYFGEVVIHNINSTLE